MLTPRHASSQIPPLPGSFDDQERRIDAQITQALGVDANMVPEGLADRVYQASVRGLPAPLPLPLREAQPLRPHRLVVGRLAWGRLAMAASVLLGIGLGIWSLQPSRPVGPSSVAQIDIRLDGPLATELAMLPQGSATDMENELSYLLDTNDLTSFEVLSGDLVRLLADVRSAQP